MKHGEPPNTSVMFSALHVCRVLQLLGHRLPTLLLAGQHSLTAQWPLVQPFHKMPLQARHAVLQGWAHSSLPPLRKVGLMHISSWVSLQCSGETWLELTAS
jgi:hypothetical protein